MRGVSSWSEQQEDRSLPQQSDLSVLFSGTLAKLAGPDLRRLLCAAKRQSFRGKSGGEPGAYSRPIAVSRGRRKLLARTVMIPARRWRPSPVCVRLSGPRRRRTGSWTDPCSRCWRPSRTRGAAWTADRRSAASVSVCGLLRIHTGSTWTPVSRDEPSDVFQAGSHLSMGLVYFGAGPDLSAEGPRGCTLVLGPREDPNTVLSSLSNPADVSMFKHWWTFL